MTDEKIIAYILEENEKGLVMLYNNYRRGFIQWASKKFSVGTEDAMDIFQDSAIAIYKNIKSGKIEKFDYSVKHYLYAIGKNMLLNKIKFEKRFDREIDEINLEHLLPATPASEAQDHREMVMFVDGVLKGMGDPCYTLLKLYYYYNYSLEGIAREIGSKNANVAKAQKARCIKQLKQIFVEKYKPGEF